MKTTRLIASLLSVLILLTFTSAVLAQAAPATPAGTADPTDTPAGTATPAATPAATAAPATTPAATATAGTATPALVPAGTAAPTAAGDKTATTNEAAKTGDAKTDKKTDGEEEAVVEETFFQKYFMFIMLGGFVLLWMFMSRGRKKREAKRREMLSELTKGDKVVTIGGICGTIIETTETEITLKVGENNRMKMARWAIRMAGQEAQDDKKNDSQADAR